MTKICGIDEAGRGPLAGPVVAAAVILPKGFPVSQLKDSKKLSEPRRKKLYYQITSETQYWATGWVWPEEIDRINIHQASLLAMQRAFRGINTKPLKVYVDGAFKPALDCPTEAVIKGDNLIPVIMAASIIAKCTRDLWMERYSRIAPEYLYEKHKGYPTKIHRERIKIWGLSPIQRKTFRSGVFV
ncbi:MAG: ribonuclease HII [Spirochaetales bacterium]|nr:ribonuclease HII [Spirochaetales bacterium]